MAFFRTRRGQKLLLLASLLKCLLFIGCSASVEDEEETSQVKEESNFVISSIKMVSTPQQIFENTDAVSRPTHKKYKFKACFKDSIFVDNLRFARFQISEKNKTYTADSEGCIRWSEVLEYKTSVGNRYHKLERTIKSASQFKGETTVPFAVNVITNRFIDLRNEEIPDNSDQILTKDDREVEFEMTRIKLRFGGYSMRHNDSRALKEVFSMGKACFNYKIDKKPLVRKNLTIELVDQEGNVVQTKGPVTTKLDGCLPLSIKTKFDQFDEMQWLKRTLKVKILEGKISGQVLEKDFFVNPWMKSFNHFWDSRYGEAPQNPTGESAKLHFDHVDIAFHGNKEDAFKVNHYMDMSLTKRYLLTFEPKINRSHNFSTNQIVDPIFTGEFLVRVAVLSPKKGNTELTTKNLDDFKFLSGAEEKVNVIDGKIITNIDLPFKFKDMPKVGRRTIIVMELTSLDPEAENLNPIITSGQFLPTEKKQNLYLRPHTRNLPMDYKLNIKRPKLMAKLQMINDVNSHKDKLESDWQGSSMQIFHALTRNQEGKDPYLTIPFKKAQRLLPTELTKSELKTLRKNPENKEALKKLCRYYFKKEFIDGWFPHHKEHPAYRRCQRNPQKYINVKPVKHVHEVHSSPKKLFTNNNDRIDIGTGFVAFDSDSDRQSTATRHSLSGGLDLKIPFFSIFSAGGGYKTEISSMQSQDQAEGSQFQSRISRSRTMYVDQIQLGFDATVKNCLLIEGTEYKTFDYQGYGFSLYVGIMGDFQSETHKMKKRAQICEDEAQKEWVEESWYYINEPLPYESGLTDRLSPDEAYFAKILRGEENYQKFYNLMSDTTKVIHLRKLENLENNNELIDQIYKPKEGYPFLNDGGIPGIIQP